MAVSCSILFACAARTDSPHSTGGHGVRPPPGGPSTVLGTEDGQDIVAATSIDARPAAIVEGRIVDWGEMRPLLNEAAGADVLREIVLDRMLPRALDAAGIVIDDQDLERERALFYRTLGDDPDVAARLARQVRARQGIGRHRFERLLRRNAGLRALVQDQVEVTDDTVLVAFDAAYGPKRQARLIVVATLAEARDATGRVEAGELFSDVAVEFSTDSSASRGGLLQPVSRLDTSYPEAMRQALWALEEPGGISPPVLLGDSYAVLMYVRPVDAGSVTIEDVRAELEKTVRLGQERVLMDQLARRLYAGATVTIVDDALQESWNARLER